MSAFTPARQPLSRGERVLLVVLGLAVIHHVDHVLRADNSGWPFISDVTPFTISLIVYPIFALDFLLLRKRPGIRAALVGFLFVVLLLAHGFLETPADQYSTWANGVSAVPHAVGRPNLLEISSPLLGIASVMVSLLLSAAVLVAFMFLRREAERGQPAS